MRYITSHFSVAGKVRPVNEDSLCYRQAFFGGHELVMATICDGMGGLSRGEIASGHVVKRLFDWFESKLPSILEKYDFSSEIIINEWKRLIGSENKELFYEGQSSGNKLGTTLSVIVIFKGHYVIGHVGDSRIYHIGLFCRCLTDDQSLVAHELSEGLITRREARRDKRINVLLECIGASEVVHPLFYTGKVRGGKILLCTDGLWHKLQVFWLPIYFKRIWPVNLIKQNEKKLEKITMRIEADGEEDNISSILIDIGR